MRRANPSRTGTGCACFGQTTSASRGQYYAHIAYSEICRTLHMKPVENVKKENPNELGITSRTGAELGSQACAGRKRYGTLLGRKPLSSRHRRSTTVYPTPSPSPQFRV